MDPFFSICCTDIIQDSPNIHIKQNHVMPNTAAGGRNLTFLPEFLPILQKLDVVNIAATGTSNNIQSRKLFKIIYLMNDFIIIL